jgi:hypothetical protein
MKKQLVGWLIFTVVVLILFCGFILASGGSINSLVHPVVKYNAGTILEAQRLTGIWKCPGGQFASDTKYQKPSCKSQVFYGNALPLGISTMKVVEDEFGNTSSPDGFTSVCVDNLQMQEGVEIVYFHNACGWVSNDDIIQMPKTAPTPNFVQK